MAAPVPAFSADGTGPTPTALRTDVLGSPTAAAAAAAAAGQRTPGSSAKARQLVYLGQLYGVEVVGRKCSVLHNRHGKQGFEKAHILDFDPRSGQHKLRHHVDRVEEWLSLADIKFKWTQGATPEAAPNPTFKPELCGEAAVGKRLRVYWPAMQKWYCGTVRAYDPVSGLHTVYYKDGDQQALMLKHEPVIWADDELAMQDGANPLITWVAANSGSGSEVWGAGAGGSTPRHPSSSTAVGAGAPAPALVGAGGGGVMQPPAAPVAAPAGMIPVAATGAAATGGNVVMGGQGGMNMLGSRNMVAPPGPHNPTSAAGVSQGAAMLAGRSAGMTAAAAAAMHTAILRTVFPATPPGRVRIRIHRGKKPPVCTATPSWPHMDQSNSSSPVNVQVALARMSGRGFMIAVHFELLPCERPSICPYQLRLWCSCFTACLCCCVYAQVGGLCWASMLVLRLRQLMVVPRGARGLWGRS